MSDPAQTHNSPEMPHQAQDLSGKTLGDYRILRKLGQGGMGQVYLAEQISLKRKVALKILRPDNAANSQAQARFKREAETVAKATHANIVQVHAFGEVEGLLFMALEYVEGRNLKEFVVKKGPPDLPIALSIMRQVASALQRAGELGLIHRDIKPENILLTRKGEAKVADFGLALPPENDRDGINLTQSGITMGTPLYMSPEQVQGKAVDSRTDIYSFGVTCFFMLTGQPPFRGTTAFDVAVQHVQKEAPTLRSVRPDLPENLCNLVQRMMAKQPEQRVQTARDLLREILKLRESPGGEIGEESLVRVQLDTPSLDISGSRSGITSTRKREPWAQSQWIALGVGLSLLGALAGGAALARRDRQRQLDQEFASIEPSDVRVLDTITLPQRREAALRTLVDQGLNPSAGKQPDAACFANSMELGLYYLDQGRLDDAANLFSRLKSIREPASLSMLGKTGQGIVLALRNQARDSNQLFLEVFAPDAFQIGPPGKGKKGTPPPGMIRRIETHLLPIRSFMDHPRGRHWLGMARYYNSRNGLSNNLVPRYLLWRFPLESEKKPAP